MICCAQFRQAQTCEINLNLISILYIALYNISCWFLLIVLHALQIKTCYASSLLSRDWRHRKRWVAELEERTKHRKFEYFLPGTPLKILSAVCWSLTSSSTWKRTKSSTSIHIWTEKEQHNAIFGRTIKFSIWCSVSGVPFQPPKTDAQIQLYFHCFVKLQTDVDSLPIYRKLSTK